MTENSSHQYTHPTDDTETIIATCGRGGRAYQARIFDQFDPERVVPAGTIGQIGGIGASLMLGYLDDQTSTESSFNADGYFLSGDLGMLDEAGNLTVHGRLKDIIIRGGNNVDPSRIEGLARRHKGVESVACIPVRDDRLGERVCIAIIGTADAEDLLRHLDAEGLSRYDMPEFFLRLTEFPMTASGKVLKRELIDMVQRGDLVPQSVSVRARQKVQA